MELPGNTRTAQTLSKGVLVEDATLYRIIRALVDECPPTLFSEQIADVLKVNGEVLDA